MQVSPADLPDFPATLLISPKPPARHGVLAYDAAVVDASRGRLLVMERWRDQQALSAHLAAADTVAFVARWAQRFSADVRKYDATRERALADA